MSDGVPRWRCGNCESVTYASEDYPPRVCSECGADKWNLYRATAHDEGADYHPCESVDYVALYGTLLESAAKLVEHGEYDAADELWATAHGLVTELHHCQEINSHPDPASENER